MTPSRDTRFGFGSAALIALSLLCGLCLSVANAGAQSAPSQPTKAQVEATKRLGRPVTNTEIVEAIRRSGLSREQVRNRLAAAGYDPALSDPFFDAARSGATGSAATAGAVSALVSIGLVQDDRPVVTEETTASDVNPTSSLPVAASALTADHLEVFGKEVFRRGATQVDPITSGPVDPAYRVGVGDQLQLLVTGEVQRAYTLDIRRDGAIVVPDVGRIELAGLTLESARALVKARVSRVLSSVAQGTAEVDLAISRIRSILVYVIGEVEQPGGYQISALSTAFSAIARAGGPSYEGSFRSIQLRRGNETLRTFDLYGYLMAGDGSADLRLEQGDVLYVPLAQKRIGVRGAVRRSARFELLATEGLGDLLRFAGGFRPEAATERVQIDRILSPSERRPGVERVKLDVALGTQDLMAKVALNDGDNIEVFSIGGVRRNVFSVLGEINRPGLYEWHPGITLRAAIKTALGALPWGQVDRVKLRRMRLDTGREDFFSIDMTASVADTFTVKEFDEIRVLDSRIMFPNGFVRVSGAVRNDTTISFGERISLRDALDVAGGAQDFGILDRVMIERRNDETGQSRLITVNATSDTGRSVALERGDIVTLLDRRKETPQGSIGISGAVVQPGERPYLIGESLSAAIARSGGLREDAAFVTVYRRRREKGFSDTTTTPMSFAALASAEWRSQSSQFLLQRDDRIVVAIDPGFRQATFVTVSGAVLYPGAYSVVEGSDRVTDAIRKAGGLLPRAYAASLRLNRGGRPVALDGAKALRERRASNVLLRAGDEITLGIDPQTVAVGGAVERPGLIVYTPGASMSDYVKMAGGARREGDVERAIVESPSGMSRRPTRMLSFMIQQPEVQSGSAIFVPAKPASRASSLSLATVLQSATALASIIVAYAAIRR